MLNTDMVGQGKPVMAVGGGEVYPDDAKRIGFDVDGFKWEAFRSQKNVMRLGLRHWALWDQWNQ